MPSSLARSRRRLLHQAGRAVAAAAVVPLLAACGGGAAATTAGSQSVVASGSISASASAASSGSASTSASAAPAAAKGPDATATAKAAIPKVSAGTLLFSTYGSDQEGKVWDQAVEAFNKVHPDVKIQHDQVAGSFTDKVLAEAAAGTPSDVMEFETKRMTSYFNGGLYLPLDKYVSTSKLIKPEDFFAFSWKKATLAGKLYGIPWDEAPAVLFYSVDLFRQNGIDMPPTTWATPDWSWDTYVQVCQKLTKKSGANPAFAVRWSNWWIYSLPMIWSNGSDLLNADFTKSNLTAPGTVEGFQYVYDLRWKYHVDPTPDESKQHQEEAFNQGLLAMVFTNAAYGVVARDKFTNTKWDVAPVPTGKGGAWTRSPADALTIAAESKQADKAWTFVEWANTADGQQILMLQGRVPTRSDVAYGAYLKQQPAINWKLIADGAKDHQKNQPVTDKFQEMDTLLSNNWNGPVFDKNSMAPQDFAQKSDGPLNALLAQATYRRVLQA